MHGPGEIEYVIPDFPGRYKLLVVPQREREKPPSPSYPLDMYLPLALSKYKPEFDSESESESRSIRWVSTDCDATV